ncbi:TetR/AcrR family transcriptional regulator [Salinibacterium sp. ZJ454]|uniref:TetR/AcrR family transcriptional regulator n=1 Tax=Salinibacterium sp. ZJ454 TaxID=2708339 RepID=UPI00142117BC|nr:TetR/AcrR family transcriptional regulator [Salinibacterium sp. ZJ454]
MVRPTAQKDKPTARKNRAADIQTAAIKVFSEKGYSAASLQDLAEEVGLLKGSLYYYIDSKESILFEIFENSNDAVVEIMRLTDAQNLEPRDRLLEYTRQLTYWYLEHRDRASLYFTEWRYLTGEYSDIVREQRRQFISYVRQIIAEAQARGLTAPDVDVNISSVFIMSAVNSVPIWYQSSGPITRDEIAERTAELATRAVFG